MNAWLAVVLGVAYPRLATEPGAAVAAPRKTPSPSFLPAASDEVCEKEARDALAQMRSVTLTMDGHVKAEVPTVYLDGRGASPKGGRFKELKTRLKQFMAESPIIDKPGGLGGILSAMAPSVRPRVLLLHGADASTLEWRYLVPRLNELGVDAVAVDWWSGGFTSRAAILGELDHRRSQAPRPWTLVTEHLHAFWKRQLDSRPVIVVGASLGGAVALDFAATFPEAVSGLVLVDGG